MQDPGCLVWMQVRVYVSHTDWNISAFIIPVHYTDKTSTVPPAPCQQATLTSWAAAQNKIHNKHIQGCRWGTNTEGKCGYLWMYLCLWVSKSANLYKNIFSNTRENVESISFITKSFLKNIQVEIIERGS